MKKLYFKIIVIIFIMVGFSTVCFANGSDTVDYNETKKNINSYIENQLEKINLNEYILRF